MFSNDYITNTKHKYGRRAKSKIFGTLSKQGKNLNNARSNQIGHLKERELIEEA